VDYRTEAEITGSGLTVQLATVTSCFEETTRVTHRVSVTINECPADGCGAGYYFCWILGLAFPIGGTAAGAAIENWVFPPVFGAVGAAFLIPAAISASRLTDSETALPDDQ
jgi:hypothetical protein